MLYKIEALHKCCIVDSRVALKCEHYLPLLSAACNHSGCQWIAEKVMPVKTAYVVPHNINVLRDSGYSSAVVKQSLVDPKEMTGKCKHCVLIDGTVKKVEVAKIYVDTPFYKGELEVLCMENPIYDLLTKKGD